MFLGALGGFGGLNKITGVIFSTVITFSTGLVLFVLSFDFSFCADFAFPAGFDFSAGLTAEWALCFSFGFVFGGFSPGLDGPELLRKSSMCFTILRNSGLCIDSGLQIWW
jgi:hypothetical protein